MVKRRGVDSKHPFFAVFAGNLDGKGFFQKKTAAICKRNPFHQIMPLRRKGKRLSLNNRHLSGTPGGGTDQYAGEETTDGNQKEQPCRQEADAPTCRKGRAC